MKKIGLFCLMLFIFLKCHALNSDILYKPIVIYYGVGAGKTFDKFEINAKDIGFEEKEYYSANECKKAAKIVTDKEEEYIKEKWKKWNRKNRINDHVIYSEDLIAAFCIPKDESLVKFDPYSKVIDIENIKDYPLFTDQTPKIQKEIKYKEDMYRFVMIFWNYYGSTEYSNCEVSDLGAIEKKYYTKKECEDIISKYIQFQKEAEVELGKEGIPFHKFKDNTYSVMGSFSSVHCYPVDESKLNYDPVAEIPLEDRGRILEYPIFLDDPRPVYKTSFSCNPKKWTVTEKLICTNEVLADLDIQLNTIYKKALKNASTLEEKQDIQEAQREWVEEQSGTLSIIELRKLYKNRIKELSGE